VGREGGFDAETSAPNLQDVSLEVFDVFAFAAGGEGRGGGSCRVSLCFDLLELQRQRTNQRRPFKTHLEDSLDSYSYTITDYRQITGQYKRKGINMGRVKIILIDKQNA
jgi:hypothetical protein